MFLEKTMKLFFLLSGAERSKDIHPHQGLSLYGEDATQKTAEAVDFLPFWYRGTRDEFLRLASSNKRQSRAVYRLAHGERAMTLTFIIYYHAKTPRGMGCETPTLWQSLAIGGRGGRLFFAEFLTSKGRQLIDKIFCWLNFRDHIFLCQAECVAIITSQTHLKQLVIESA